MEPTHLPAIGAACLLVAAASTDIRGFVIPNWVSLSLLVLLALALGLGLREPSLLSSAAAFVLVLVVTGSLWLSGRFGGGDFKLMTAFAPWAGLEGLPDFLLHTALAGGVLAAAYLAIRKLIPAASRLRSMSALRPTFEHAGIPYGVAIAAGGISVLIGTG